MRGSTPRSMVPLESAIFMTGVTPTVSDNPLNSVQNTHRDQELYEQPRRFTGIAWMNGSTNSGCDPLRLPCRTVIRPLHFISARPRTPEETQNAINHTSRRVVVSRTPPCGASGWITEALDTPHNTTESLPQRTETETRNLHTQDPRPCDSHILVAENQTRSCVYPLYTNSSTGGHAVRSSYMLPSSDLSVATAIQGQRSSIPFLPHGSTSLVLCQDTPPSDYTQWLSVPHLINVSRYDSHDNVAFSPLPAPSSSRAPAPRRGLSLCDLRYSTTVLPFENLGLLNSDFLLGFSTSRLQCLTVFEQRLFGSGRERPTKTTLAYSSTPEASSKDHMLNDHETLRVSASSYNICAICCGEFLAGDPLRFLNQCHHRYHVLCVDRWFESNSTCPICRCNLKHLTVVNGSRSILTVPQLSSASQLESESVQITPHGEEPFV